MTNSKKPLLITDAIRSLVPDAKYVAYGLKYSDVVWYDERPIPSEKEVLDEYNRLLDEEPKKALRQRRDILLQQSDWSQLYDIPNETKMLWQKYRQLLRDIPQQKEFPNNVKWPKSPNSVRARNSDGTFIADDPSTPDVDEAWETK